MSQKNKQEELRRRLYSEVKENLVKQGHEIPFSEEAFLCVCKQPIKEFDLFELSDLDNKSFLEAFYLGAFFRLPEKNERVFWEKYYGLSKREFQRMVYYKLSENLKKSCIVKNNIYRVN